MRQSIILLGSLLMIFISNISVAAGSENKQSWSTYTGAWFKIEFPPGFEVRPSLDDSAFFISPDKKVEFYVFSPQWNGEPTDFVFTSQSEKEIAREEQKSEQKIVPGFTVQWVTVKAKNGSYWRSWVDKETENNTRTVFGIKYQNQEVYKKYKEQYRRFKGSLIQYAD